MENFEIYTPAADAYSNSDKEIKTDCNMMQIYNKTDVLCTINGMPVSAGGTHCFPWINGGTYNKPLTLSFTGTATGLVYVQRYIKHIKTSC
ncbi:MAG: hypothetical protein ACXWW0_00115 [Bacteroidia bacterium]